MWQGSGRGRFKGWRNGGSLWRKKKREREMGQEKEIIKWEAERETDGNRAKRDRKQLQINSLSSHF